MNKKVLFPVLCVLLVILLVGAVMFYNRFSESYRERTEMNVVTENGGSADAQENNQSGTETNNNSNAETNSENVAPDVEIFDADGNSIMLSSFYGKPVVLNFWATWCGPCKSELPGFDRLYNKYKDRINFVMLNVSDNEKTASAFLEENEYGFPVYYDKTQIASYTYGASSIPLTFVLYEGGEVYGYQIGALPEEALERVIKAVLGED